MFVSVIANISTWLLIKASIIKQFADQIRIRLISQLVNGISSVLQKLLKQFNGILLSIFCVPSFSVLPSVFVLH